MKTDFTPYKGAAGGWGSARSLGNILRREAVPDAGLTTLMRQNKVDGFACVSCAWPKPAQAHTFEYCENGAKATAWEITRHRTTPEFFANHTCAELRDWEDYNLEQQGRITHPMRWDAASDKYHPVSWDAAFAEIGAELRQMHPDETVWYASGRASLEAAYMWALSARLYGTNNLPDSSNMCHESTSVGLTAEHRRSPVGTATYDDLRTDRLHHFLRPQPGQLAPRCCTRCRTAQSAACRSLSSIRCESGLGAVHQSATRGGNADKRSTPISTQYHQVHLGRRQSRHYRDVQIFDHVGRLGESPAATDAGS